MLLFTVSQKLSCNLERTTITVWTIIFLLMGVNNDTVGFALISVCWDENSLILLWWHWNCFCLSFPEESYSYCLGMKNCLLLISPSKWVHVIRVKKRPLKEPRALLWVRVRLS